MKWLKIAGLGTAIWTLNLIWLELNEVLTSPIILIFIVGLALLLPVYLLGNWLGRRDRSRRLVRTHVDPTRPARAVIFARHHHSLPTRPMPAIQPLHSQPTRPMSMTIYR
jgi:hypothetical protein